MNALIAHITFDQTKSTFVSTIYNKVTEINASVIPFIAKPDHGQAENISSNSNTTLNVFPDCYATITLMCQDWLLVEFVVEAKQQARTSNGFILSGQPALMGEYQTF